jgi:hypothetical protein
VLGRQDAGTGAAIVAEALLAGAQPPATATAG